MNSQSGTKGAHKMNMFYSACFNILSRGIRACLVTVFVTGAIAHAGPQGGSARGRGGDGSGGGNTSTSDEVIVRNQIDNIKPRLLAILKRREAWNNDEFRGGQIVFADIENFFKNKDLPDVIKNMKVVPQVPPCNPAGTDDKAGYGYQKTQTICLSVGELVKLPQDESPLEIDALAFHEVAHLLGLDEIICKAIQTDLLNHPLVTDLRSNKLRPMIRAYDSALKAIGDVINAASYLDRADLCRRVSAFEVRREILESTLDTPPGNWLRVQLVPRSMFPDEVSTAMIPIMNWGNKICVDAVLTKADRIKVLEAALGAANHLLERRMKLGAYIDPMDPYLPLPSLVGLGEVVEAQPHLAGLRSGLDIKKGLLKAEDVACRLTETSANREVNLDRIRGGNLDGSFQGRVFDQKGTVRDFNVTLFWSGKVIVGTEFSKSDIHITTAGAGGPVRIASYLDATVHGIYAPLASLKGFKSFEMEFFVTDRDTSFTVKPSANTYRLSCQVK